LRVFVLLLLIALICCWGFLALGQAAGVFWSTYVIPSLLWIGVAGLIKIYPAARSAAKPRWKKLLCWLALISAFMGILAAYGAGLLDGFGKSPYDLSLRGITINFLYLGAMVAGMETGRAWLLGTVFRERPVVGITLVSLCYSLFWFSLSRITALGEALEAVKFIGSIFLPAAAENVLISYLAFWGGALPAIIYRGVLLLSRWFFPVLPDLDWITQSLAGTFAPILGLIVVHQFLMSELYRSKRKTKEAGGLLGWLVFSVASVLLIWFSIGVFSIFPTAIVSGSMLPEIGIGDVVIIRKTPADTVGVGDVIQFKRGCIRVAHRVVEIENDDEGRRILWTKGDANRSRDADPVLPEDVIGKIIYRVPKAGWISMITRSRDSDLMIETGR
ncbi:MAG TPA: signal peptidase I, partial [Firmicutes bacterium]|nr:signal peptidase I [Bacillota bacterium]